VTWPAWLTLDAVINMATPTVAKIRTFRRQHSIGGSKR
jgi:hypothetical protein